MAINDYYYIATKDMLTLKKSSNESGYNVNTVQVQQIAEKLLKSVLYVEHSDNDKIMHTHNLKLIYDTICESTDELSLNRESLSFLKDYYFDARYPGDNFITVSKEDYYRCVEITNSVLSEVNKYRKKRNLPVHPMTVLPSIPDSPEVSEDFSKTFVEYCTWLDIPQNLREEEYRRLCALAGSTDSSLVDKFILKELM